MAICFRDFIPPYLLLPTQCGSLSRRWTFSKENTFWAFFSQVLDEDVGCQEVQRKMQACAAMKSQPLPSSSTSAYCQARAKLKLDDLESVLRHTSDRRLVKPDLGVMQGRRVVVVDGTGVSMPDTVESQEVWPQQSHQMPDCGRPQAAICACFCLQRGLLLRHEVGNKKKPRIADAT